MNVMTASGNIGKDAAIRQAGSSTVTGFPVAVRAGFGQREQTIWLDCAIWGKRGDALMPYLVKGQQVVVSGELSTREHNGKTYLQLKCNNVTLVGGNAGSQDQGGGQQQSQSQGSNPPPSDDFDDSIPF